MIRKPAKRIKEPTQNLIEYYEKNFVRNQRKWITRSKLTEEHLGAEFDLNGEKHKLLGTVKEDEVLVHNIDTDEYFIMDIDVPTNAILM